MSLIKSPLIPLLFFALALLPLTAHAADAHAAMHPSNADAVKIGTSLVLSAPPRGTLAEETQNYQPLADLLTRVTGRKVVYEHSGNWLSYSQNMTRGKYDFVFDGPHFNGWRMEKLNHTPLVKLPGDFIFVLVTKADNKAIKELKQLAGRRICAHAPPNLGTLTIQSQFTNPARQPNIVEVKGWELTYKELIAGKCVAGIIPLKIKEKLDKDKNLTQVLYKSKALPDQALSAGARVPPAMQQKVKEALLSAEGKAATNQLRSAYAGKDFIPATREEYAGLGIYLKDALYYSN
jgi:ABC-type phosphate/phosphonate transport system substrate-binding protein